MLTVLNFIAAIIAFWSGILVVVSFTHFDWKHKRFWMIGTLVLSIVLVVMIYRQEAHKREAAIIAERARSEEARSIALREDANRVASSITLSGWENAGDYLAYLAATAGFYARHADIYPQEAEQMKKEFSEWSDDIRKFRTEGKDVPFDVRETLKGLVSGHKSRLFEIGKRG
jgi:hypothetical protein